MTTITDEGDIEKVIAHLDTVEVLDRIILIKAPADGTIAQDWFDEDSATRLAEAVRIRGGICVLFLTEGWTVESVRRGDLLAMLEQAGALNDSDGSNAQPSEQSGKDGLHALTSE